MFEADVLLSNHAPSPLGRQRSRAFGLQSDFVMADRFTILHVVGSRPSDEFCASR